MPLVTKSDFRARFPEFSKVATYTDATIGLLIEDAEDIVKEEIYKENTKRAISYLAAHFLVLATESKDGDSDVKLNLVSHTTGSVSESYSVSQTTNENDRYYDTTKYGQRFLTYKNVVGVGAVYAI